MPLNAGIVWVYGCLGGNEGHTLDKMRGYLRDCEESGGSLGAMVVGVFAHFVTNKGD